MPKCQSPKGQNAKFLALPFLSLPLLLNSLLASSLRVESDPKPIWGWRGASPGKLAILCGSLEGRHQHKRRRRKDKLPWKPQRSSRVATSEHQIRKNTRITTNIVALAFFSISLSPLNFFISSHPYIDVKCVYVYVKERGKLNSSFKFTFREFKCGPIVLHVYFSHIPRLWVVVNLRVYECVLSYVWMLFRLFPLIPNLIK